MTRSERLRPLAQVADRKQHDAALAFKKSQEELAGYQRRLVEMRGYREEYVQRFHDTGNAGMNADQMKDYRAFLGKLHEAIRQLENLIATTSKNCESRKEDWVARRTRYKSVEKVVSRYLVEEQRDVLRREDRESDERTQRRREEAM